MRYLYKKYAMPILARIFGTKHVGYDCDLGDCDTIVTSYYWRGIIYITKLEQK